MPAAAVVAVDGINLKAASSGHLGAAVPERPNLAPVVLDGLGRDPVNRIDVAVGTYREVNEREGNNTLATAQALRAPVTVNGRITAGKGGADTDLFRVTMGKGQTLVVNVAAQRLGSALDSLLEVVDADGQPVRARGCAPCGRRPSICAVADRSTRACACWPGTNWAAVTTSTSTAS